MTQADGMPHFMRERETGLGGAERRPLIDPNSGQRRNSTSKAQDTRRVTHPHQPIIVRIAPLGSTRELEVPNEQAPFLERATHQRVVDGQRLPRGDIDRRKGPERTQHAEGRRSGHAELARAVLSNRNQSHVEVRYSHDIERLRRTTQRK